MKSIIIQEGGINKTLSNIKKIQTAKSGSNDDIYWIPEDEAKLGEKTISKNGTYKAEDDNLYGYSKVIVKGVGKASGVKPGSGTPPSQGGNGNDNEYSAEKDDDTGELVEKVLPSSIKVTTPPTKTTYQNGETIDTTGMVVTAYKNDGIIWSEDPNYPNGIIPLSEITIEPNTAVYDGSGGHDDERSTEYDDITTNSVPINIGDVAWVYSDYLGHGEAHKAISGSGPFYACATRYITTTQSGLGSYIASPNSFTGESTNRYKKTGENTWQTESVLAYTKNDKTVYYIGRNSYQDDFNPTTELPQTEVDFTKHNIGNYMWVMVYGTEIEKKQINTITSSWNRVGDEQELTDTFDITVIP